MENIADKSAEGPIQLKILHVINHTQRANGNVCAMIDLACTQVSHGHKVYICSSGGNFAQLFANFGIRHIKVDFTRRLPVLAKALWQLRNAISEVKPDIVHAHMMTSAMLAAVLCGFHNFKLITTVHNEFETSAVLMRVGHRVIGVSDAVSRSLVRRGIPNTVIRTVLNGTINSPRFTRLPPVPKKLSSPAIVFVGGLHPRKGVDDLIEAHGIVLKKCPQAHLFIVGSGPYKEEYEKLARNVSNDKIIFCGYKDDPREFLCAADIFVLPSHADPAPLVLSEARAAGCAIVASDVGGIPEMLENGTAGILVQAKRPDLLAEALVRLIENPHYLSEMRAKSQINISNMMLDRVTRETLSVYREVLDSGRSSKLERLALTLSTLRLFAATKRLGWN